VLCGKNEGRNGKGTNALRGVELRFLKRKGSGVLPFVGENLFQILLL